VSRSGIAKPRSSLENSHMLSFVLSNVVGDMTTFPSSSSDKGYEHLYIIYVECLNVLQTSIALTYNFLQSVDYYCQNYQPLF
jgi:hypothetical protein